MKTTRHWREENPQLFELNLILWAAWDPIGSPATDEYSSYVPQILALLHTHWSSEESDEDDSFEALVAELSKLRTEWMGLPPNRHEDVNAAIKLCDWYSIDGIAHDGLTPRFD